MAVKSIIDIDVNDAKFKAFMESFSKYNSALKKMPLAWSAAEMSAAAVGIATAEATAELEKQERMKKKAADEESKRLDHARKQMEAIKETTAGIAKNVANTTKNLLEWAGIGTIVSGLLGAGGLWGLDRMAASVGDARKSAMGLGINSGQQQAFNLQFGRDVNANALLSNVAGAQNDASRQWIFGAMGVRGYKDMDAATASTEIILQAKKLWDHSNKTIQAMQPSGLNRLMSYEEWRTIGGESMGDLRRRAGAYGASAKNLNLDDATQRAQQDFVARLDESNQKIKNVFIQGLVPLEGPLMRISKALSDDIAALLQNPHVAEFMDKLAVSLEEFAGYIGSDKFTKDIKNFVDDVAYASGKIIDALRFLKLIPDGVVDNTSGLPAVAGAAAGATIGGAFGGIPGAIVGGGVGGLGGLIFGNRGPGAAQASMMRNYGHDMELPGGALEALYYLESRNGTGAGLSKKGALGPFQFLSGTAKQYGITDRTDFQQEAFGAARYMHDLMKEFHGDIRKALAAYNSGQGNVEKDVRLANKYGGDWLRFAPKETRDYVASGMKIIISNQTGGNANVQANQAAGQK